VVVDFKIKRDGNIANFRIKQSSGDNRMDDAARNAVAAAAPFSPLPPGKEKTVDIDFTLDYNVHRDKDN
jgi:TonB family protein